MAVEARTTDLAHHHIDLIAADAAIAKLRSIGKIGFRLVEQRSA
jgi:hypothetical protein